MSSFKLNFAPLNLNGDNYMGWSDKVIRYLKCKGLEKLLKDASNVATSSIIGPNDKTTEKEKEKAEEELEMKKAKALRLIADHLDDSLQLEYRGTEDPKILWDALKERFGYPREVLLPAAVDDWNKLRFQDFKSVVEYNSAMFKIVSQLEYCGRIVTEEEKLEKTFSTFHASYLVLQQQYRLRGYKRYSELVTALLLAEKNNELLIKNHQSRPTGAMAFTETNVTTFNQGRGGIGRFGGRGRGRGRGRNHFRGRGRGRGYHFRPPRNDQMNKVRQEKGKFVQEGPSRNHEDACFRCGKRGHWSKACRTPEYLCKRNKAYVEGKGKEVNFNEHKPEDESTYLEVADFVEGENEMRYID